MSDKQDPVALARDIAAFEKQWREVEDVLSKESSVAWKRLDALCTHANTATLARAVLNLAPKATKCEEMLCDYGDGTWLEVCQDRDANKRDADAARAEVERLQTLLDKCLEAHGDQVGKTKPEPEQCNGCEGALRAFRAALGEEDKGNTCRTST